MTTPLDWSDPSGSPRPVRDLLPRFTVQHGGIRYRSPSEWVAPEPLPLPGNRERLWRWVHIHRPRRWVWEAKKYGGWEDPSRSLGFYGTEPRARSACEEKAGESIDWSDEDESFPYSVRRERAKVRRRVEL
jgi:hypothetical protein